MINSLVTNLKVSETEVNDFNQCYFSLVLALFTVIILFSKVVIDCNITVWKV